MDNRLRIRDGCAEFTEAGCPDALCVHMRPISAEGEMLVCLPNRVVVEVRNGKNGDNDAVAY